MRDFTTTKDSEWWKQCIATATYNVGQDQKKKYMQMNKDIGVDPRYGYFNSFRCSPTALGSPKREKYKENKAKLKRMSNIMQQQTELYSKTKHELKHMRKKLTKVVSKQRQRAEKRAKRKLKKEKLADASDAADQSLENKSFAPVRSKKRQYYKVKYS